MTAVSSSINSPADNVLMFNSVVFSFCSTRSLTVAESWLNLCSSFLCAVSLSNELYCSAMPGGTTVTAVGAATA